MTTARRYLAFSPNQWLTIAKRALTLSRECHIGDFACSVAFNAFLAFFPGMLAILSLYGLFIDQDTVEQQVSAVSGYMPANVSSIVSERLTSLAMTSSDSLGWGLTLSIVFATYVSFRGTSTLLLALRMIQFPERSGVDKVAASTVGLCAAAAVALILACLAVIIVVPALLDSVGPIRLLLWPAIFLLICSALGLLYSVSRNAEHDTSSRARDLASDDDGQQLLLSKWFSPGAIAGSGLWLAGSALFSYYVTNFAQYEVLFGSLAAVAVLMIWLYLTNFVVLLGAVLNTAIVATRDHSAGEKSAD